MVETTRRPKGVSYIKQSEGTDDMLPRRVKIIVRLNPRYEA
jgi:hypothetical protein